MNLRSTREQEEISPIIKALEDKIKKLQEERLLDFAIFLNSITWNSIAKNNYKPDDLVNMYFKKIDFINTIQNK